MRGTRHGNAVMRYGVRESGVVIEIAGFSSPDSTDYQTSFLEPANIRYIEAD